MTSGEITPRRSTRGQIFTPTQSTPAQQPKNVTYQWTSSPLPLSDSNPASLDPEGRRTYYDSYKRITTSIPKRTANLTPGRQRKAPKAEEEEFDIGDGVLVKVEGGADGVGILIRLWEEPDDDESDEEDEEKEDDEEETPGEKEKAETKMMGEVHWCFRREDLPSVMKNLTVYDVSLSLSLAIFRSPLART